MTTIEQLKSQLKICQDLGLTADVEQLQHQLEKLVSPAPTTFVINDISKLSKSEHEEYEERAAITKIDSELSKAEFNPNEQESPLDLDAPPRRLYMDAEHEEIIAEILRLERKHIKEGLYYDRVRYLGDNTLNQRREFLLDYLYSLCDHLENYRIGIHDLAERQAIREKEVEQKLKQQQKPKVEIVPEAEVTSESVAIKKETLLLKEKLKQLIKEAHELCEALLNGNYSVIPSKYWQAEIGSFTVASVKFFLTNADKVILRKLGYTNEEIKAMKPDEGAAIIAANKTKAKT
jgi:hypothetical protein